MQNKFNFGLSRKDNLLDLRNNKMVKTISLDHCLAKLNFQSCLQPSAEYSIF